jgi:hypothetical protein
MTRLLVLVDFSETNLQKDSVIVGRDSNMSFSHSHRGFSPVEAPLPKIALTVLTV